MNTEKIYKQAKDEHVAGVIVYAKAEDVFGGTEFVAYKDEQGNERFTMAELRDAFLKGCVININNFYMIKPAQFKLLTNEDGFESVELVAYYDNSEEEDGSDCMTTWVVTWDGELPSDLGE